MHTFIWTVKGNFYIAGTFDQGQNTNPPPFPPSSSQGGQPPSYSQVMPPSYTQATAPPGNPELYGGYGKGS